MKEAQNVGVSGCNTKESADVMVIYIYIGALCSTVFCTGIWFERRGHLIMCPDSFIKRRD